MLAKVRGLNPKKVPDRQFLSPAGKMMPLSNKMLAVISHYTEKYILSGMYLYLTVLEARKIWFRWSSPPTGISAWMDAGHHLTLLLLVLSTGIFLLSGHRAVVPPQKLKFILVPLAATFFNYFYYTVPWFPHSWQASLCPQRYQAGFLIAGLGAIFLGQVIALCGILYPGRFFGIMVTVRKVVLTGPYRWVRHPIYLGWLCVYLGLALANFSGAYFLLVGLDISVLLYRARLEESQLAACSTDYRESMRRVGFIFPRFYGSARRAT